MKSSFCFTVFFFRINFFSFSQEINPVKTSFSGYIDSYYSYDFNIPETEKKLPFMYNYNRQNEFNLNIRITSCKS